MSRVILCALMLALSGCNHYAPSEELEVLKEPHIRVIETIYPGHGLFYQLIEVDGERFLITGSHGTCEAVPLLGKTEEKTCLK